MEASKRRIANLSRHINPPAEVVGLSMSETGARSQLLGGQVAIITGAGQGIGAATAKLFAENGAKVVVSDLDEAKSSAVAAEIRAAGGEAVVCAGDVTDPAFPRKVVNKALDTYGGLHILVNNAGYTWDAVIHKMTDEQWDAMIAVHNTAPFRLIREAAPAMRDAAKREMAAGGKPAPRAIVNVSSTSGLHGNFGQLNYACAKAGVVGMTKTVAKEWGPLGIRCNTIAFGLIQTRLTAAKELGASMTVNGKEVKLGVPQKMQGQTQHIPLQRAGTPEEAAGGVLMLCLPYASYITGHTLEVTGGVGI